LLLDKLHECLPVPKGSFLTSPQIAQRQAALTAVMTNLKNKGDSVMSALHDNRLSGQRFISVSVSAGNRIRPAFITPTNSRDNLMQAFPNYQIR
jgi:hypothetical protein